MTNFRLLFIFSGALVTSFIGHSVTADDDVGQACDNGCAVSCCVNPCGRIIGQADVIWLRPHDSFPDTSTSTSAEAAQRYMVGYMNSEGRSLRVRFFELDHSDFDEVRLDVETLDLEYAGQFRLGCNWEGEISGGLRWASYLDNDLDYSDTIGPAIGIELRSDFFKKVDLFTVARHSIQFGSGDSGGDSALGTFNITEIQLGVEGQRQLKNGSTGFLRFIFEAQTWSGVEDGESEDLGLVGIGFAAGIRR